MIDKLNKEFEEIFDFFHKNVLELAKKVSQVALMIMIRTNKDLYQFVIKFKTAEEKDQSIKEIAKIIAKKREFPLLYFLATEAYTVIADSQEKAKEIEEFYKTHSLAEHPDKKEILLISGINLVTLRNKTIIYFIDENRNFILDDTQKFDTDDLRDWDDRLFRIFFFTWINETKKIKKGG